MKRSAFDTLGFGGWERRGSNPFCSRLVRPGAIAWIDDEETPTGNLAWRRGVHLIVGPHGSGKTTLLHHQCRSLASSGSPDWITFASRRDAWRSISKLALAGPRIAIDGYDRAGCLARVILWTLIWMRGQSVLATSHRELLGHRTAARCRYRVSIARRIVANRMVGCDAPVQRLVNRRMESLAFDPGEQLYRDLLFDLYDVVQRASPPRHCSGEAA